jgi:hypothetical protein
MIEFRGAMCREERFSCGAIGCFVVPRYGYIKLAEHLRCYSHSQINTLVGAISARSIISDHNNWQLEIIDPSTFRNGSCK